MIILTSFLQNYFTFSSFKNWWKYCCRNSWWSYWVSTCPSICHKRWFVTRHKWRSNYIDNRSALILLVSLLVSLLVNASEFAESWFLSRCFLKDQLSQEPVRWKSFYVTWSWTRRLLKYDNLFSMTLKELLNFEFCIFISDSWSHDSCDVMCHS